MAETTLAPSELLAVDKPVARISWGGIFIGAIATIALGILMHALGAAIGLTAINPAAGQWGGSAAGIATGIWSLLSIVIPTFLGAWLAARASTVFFRRDAASLGFMTWALSFLAMLFFVTMMAQQATAQMLAAGVAAAPEAAQAVQQLPGIGQQLQQAQPGQAAAGAAEAGAVASWWFFASAFLAMIAGILGGIAGMPKAARKHLEVRRTQLRPTETRA